jgi:hypothetical protein
MLSLLFWLAAASAAQLVVFVWPIVALALTRGATWWLNLAVVVLLAVLYVDTAHCHGSQRWHCVGAPVTALLFQHIIWRGTHYSLKELKANKV